MLTLRRARMGPSAPIAGDRTRKTSAPSVTQRFAFETGINLLPMDWEPALRFEPLNRTSVQVYRLVGIGTRSVLFLDRPEYRFVQDMLVLHR